MREFLNNNTLVTDGAMGTYYVEVTGDSVSKCEMANITSPSIIEKIHREYIDAGAKIIRTNTFAANTITLSCTREYLKRIIKDGYNIAEKAVEGRDVFIGASIGPIPDIKIDDDEFDIVDEYKFIVDSFLEEGTKIFVFETFSSLDYLYEITNYIKEKNEDIFILVQLAFTMDGFTRRGLNIESYIEDIKSLNVDAFGFNCGVGPLHLYKLISRISIEDSVISALPNAGYPDIVNERSVYVNNPNYFADMMMDIKSLGVKIIGGCCGTTPVHIQKITQRIGDSHISNIESSKKEGQSKIVHSKIKGAFMEKLNRGNFIYAVELDPPFGIDIDSVINGAKKCKEMGIDLITIADSPRAIARVDSLMVSAKVKREVGIDVLPHLCCRDKNINAIRSGLLAAYIEGIRNVLIVTGDPICAEDRINTKSVFNLNSFRLIDLVAKMNNDVFINESVSIGGALNLNIPNKDNEILRMDKKIVSGASYFLTQPIFDKETIEYLIDLKSKRPEVKILAGIMPLASYKNAMFLHNEVPGIVIPDKYINMFSSDMTREEGYKVGIDIAVNICNELKSYVDGFYFITPFNRVEIIEKVISNIK
ncbi:MAG: bifunctional homocysteine S-methyltransferase/methylenetetrahydrofolate reductase [Clostridium sp.]|uniref:bifunctional homocysteine S-methyltransferase/methylenetetrahydrofolate reductase n=1 Tax=Clostridium sp. TaxID=1506 RepID=UPI002FCA91E9